MLDTTLSTIRRFIPVQIFNLFQPLYHWKLSLLAALFYGFPSKKIKVIGITGTKGKSSTVEILNAILEETGFKTALSNTIRYKVGDTSRPNLFKMSMPGRFFIQKLIRQAVDERCDYVIMEMTSQGALLYRHRFIDLDVFVFTNLTPEHIEAHGSYENYRSAKISIAKNLSHSSKDTTLIANADDPESKHFLECTADRKITYSIHELDPYEIKKGRLEFTLNGRRVQSHLSGLFNLYNILAAITVARSQGVNDEVIIRAIEKIQGIPGRVQKIVSPAGFNVIVDYAHTPDSLEKLYKVFEGSRNICILGGTGGGRDTWKREEMGRIADKYCNEIILTDEDPYDEDPRKIVADVESGITVHKPTIIMDRRLAIREAIKRAHTGDNIIITGKGTDPYIMRAKGSKVKWSDARVVQEELGDISAQK
jgi:UDP-N-acetylmuramoyl-L-alanyl-D-glutamate--2,6-diaminopimelate ligase